MATKVKQITENVGENGLLFSSWLANQGVTRPEQLAYIKSGWLERVAHGVYKIAGSHPTLLAAVSCYNTQLNKQCIIGARTALELRGLSHYVPMGKQVAYLITDNAHKLPEWLVQGEWDRKVVYQTTSFLGEDNLGVETMTIEGRPLQVSSPERAMLEWLNQPDSAASLLDIYYVMEMLTTLRPRLVQQLLVRSKSVKANRLFLYMAEKAQHSWVKALEREKINLGSGRRMIVPTGKYVSKYNMTVPSELVEYE